MSKITRGGLSVLSYPLIYDALQNIMGAQRLRLDLVANFIRPKQDSRILDIGCGTARILTHLPEGVEYWGYDISQEYIDAAYARFGEKGHFFCKTLGQEDLAQIPRVDIVLAIGVLHHLNDSLAAELFGLARNALSKNGRMITVDPCLVLGQNPIARCLIIHDRGQNVRATEDYRELASKSFGSVTCTLRHRSWIPYTHWIMECAV